MSLKTTFIRASLFMGIAFSTMQALAADGVFMVVKGAVTIESQGKVSSAKVGAKVAQGDKIISAADSRAKIVMSDKNVLNISPETTLVIEKYSNNPSDKNVELKVEQGKVRATVEQKYDGEKSKFNIKTPSAVAGVRGTDFITSYSRANRVTRVVTFSGVVAVGQLGPRGAIVNPVFVRPGETTEAGPDKTPEPPKPIPQDEVNSLDQQSNAEGSPAPQGPDSSPAPSQASSEPGPGNSPTEAQPPPSSDSNLPAAEQRAAPSEPRAPASQSGLVKADDVKPELGSAAQIVRQPNAVGNAGQLIARPPNPDLLPPSARNPFLNDATRSGRVRLNIVIERTSP